MLSERLFQYAGRTNIRCYPAHRNYSSTSKSATNLEVERKFNVTALLRSQLDGTNDSHHQHHRSKTPETSSLRFTKLPDKLINDQYFDHQNKLTSRGIWVRRRAEKTLLGRHLPFQTEQLTNIQWEAKIRLDGNYQNSTFEEIAGKEAVADVMKQYAVDVDLLQRIVDVDTRRESWIAREAEQEVNVVVDTSSAAGMIESTPEKELKFRHIVGEVELTRAVPLCGDRDKDGKVKEEVAAELRTELERFLGRNAALFPTTPAPNGKLTAYFAWRKQVEEHQRRGFEKRDG